MRIVCQKCSAAYAIDDKLVTPKGIRAQCPRCRHLQLVKHDEPALTEPAVPRVGINPGAAPAPDLLFDFEAPSGTHQGSIVTAPQNIPIPPEAISDMLDFSDLGGTSDPITTPRGLAPPPQPLRKGNTQPPPPPAPKTVPAMPQSSAPFDFSGDFSFVDPLPPPPPGPLHKQGSSPGLSLKPKADPVPQAPPSRPGAGAVVKCKQCGKVLTDPFDQALGVCDDCRNGSLDSLSIDDSAGRPTGLEPSPLGRVKAPAPSRPPPPPPPPAASDEVLTVAEGQVRPKKVQRHVQTAYREDDAPEPGSSGKVVAIAVLVLALFGGGGAWLFIKRPWVKKPPPLAQKLPTASARPIEAMVDRWKAQFPDLSGSAAEHLAAGEEKLALDSTAAYADAEVEFQKALVLDKSNDRAVAGWALALAFGKGQSVDAETLKMAEQMLLSAEARGGDARVYVAHAHVMLVRGASLNDVRQIAERGTTSPSDKDKALAYLALGQAYLVNNVTTADANFKEALKADPKLKRAAIYQVKLLTSQGDYRAAVLTLEKRLEADPDLFEAADMLGRLYVELGELASAKKTFMKAAQAAQGGGRPQLALAVLAYQHEGDAASAAVKLDELLARKDSLQKSVVVEAYGHRAAVARLLGEPAQASTSAEAALALKGDDVNAHVQKLFVSLSLGNAAAARSELTHVKLGDPGLEAALEGRCLLAEGKAGEAFDKLKKAVELDPRRTDALLLAGAAAIKAKQEGKAWEYVLAKGYKADPLQSGPRGAMAAVYVARSDLIGAARGAFTPLGKDKEDPNPHLAEGVLAWHAGDLAAADAAFARVLTADPTNAQGWAFRALVALKRKDVANASKHAAKAVVGDRTSGLAHAVLGWTQLLQNKVELARKTLQRAIELDPKLSLARVRLAEADIRVKKVAEAKAALNAVLLADPTYDEAKRVLYGIAQ